jgi:aspartyl-tRNA(Asn)/glutamyl-tRNA(Gln) amidotransferase subunit A
MSELHELSIAEAGALLRAGDTSSVELTEATLRRLEQTEPLVHAYAYVLAERALEQAAAADAELGAGADRGPLHGIPVGVKDLLHTAGTPTEGGSRVLEGFVPERDAEVVTRLADAGAVLVGKTVTHEFAYGQNVPPTRNPWETSSYPGGSSAGSGVAVAVGSAFGAIGTDTGGSIRAPAAVNGVVGLKTTAGRVSRRGVMPMSPSLDTVGPLTRTVEDTALMLGAIAGGDDDTVIDEPVPDYAASLTGDLHGVRVGVEREYFFYETVSPGVRAAVDAAIAELESLGAEIVEIEAIEHIELAAAAGMTVLVGDTSEWHQRLLRERGELYVRETRVMLELGELVLATSYAKAQRARRLVQRGMRAVFENGRLDALAAPTLPITTKLVDQLSVDLTGEGETALSAFLHHCFVANVIGIPSLSVPVGFDESRLPIGMQLFGRPFGEPALFRIGHAYQGATSWHEQRPELAAVV